MPTFTNQVVDRQIIFLASLSIGSPPSQKTNPKSYKALLVSRLRSSLHYSALLCERMKMDSRFRGNDERRLTASLFYSMNFKDRTLDTGSQATLISRKVVEEIGLTSIGTSSLVPVSGELVQTERYRVRIDVPIGSEVVRKEGVGTAVTLRGMELETPLLPYRPDNYDVLLGMDFLFPFHLTMYRGQFILSS